MQDSTLVLLINEIPPREVLLGFKKIGFGKGKFTGFGGKVEAKETFVEAAARELAEEAGILLPLCALELYAILTFNFPHRTEWSQCVHVFTSKSYAGFPVESKEMVPQWFPIDKIPYDLMWDDGHYWLPRIFAGEKFQAYFTFQADNATVNTVEFSPLNLKSFPTGKL